MIFFSAIQTTCTVLLYQRNYYSWYVSRPVLAPPPLWLQIHTDMRSHNVTHCHELWHKHRLAKFTCAWSWRLWGITLATQNCRCTSRISSQFHKAHSVICFEYLRIMCLSQPSVNKFRKRMILFTSWIHFVHLVFLDYRFVNWKWNVTQVTESDGLIILSMANDKAMTEMENFEIFSVLKMEFIVFISSWMGKIYAAICIKVWGL